jgi:hypothetical protein
MAKFKKQSELQKFLERMVYYWSRVEFVEPMTECDECGAGIPDEPTEGGLANKHHENSCSLYDADEE